MLESQMISPDAGSGVTPLFRRRAMKRSVSESDLFSSSSKKRKRTKYHESEDLESDLAPPPIRCSISDGDLIIAKVEETDTDHDAEYPNDVVTLESAIVNPPSTRSDVPPPNISPGVQVFKLNFCITKPEPKVYVDKAWELLKPALTSILHELNLDRFSFAEIHNVVGMAWWNKESEEALINLILEECGAYISTTLQSLAVHCNDGDPSLLLLLLEKYWLEFPKKLRFICDICGAGGIKLWDLGLKLFSKNLFLASQLRDKVHSIILHRITDQRLGKSVDLSQLKNLTDMFNGSIFRELRFLEKPFLDSTAEFYAAEAKQVLEQSPDLPQYLKYVHQRIGEEKEKCRNLPLFFIFQDELLEVVNRELLGVHARAILEKGFETLMDVRPQEDLSRMYHLFSEADLVGHLNDALGPYISDNGEKILKEGSTLTEFKAHVDKICYSYFLEDPLLEKTVQKCFEGLGMSVSPIVDDDPFT